MTDEQPPAPLTLAQKLHAVYSAVEGVQGSGYNQSIDYRYPNEADIFAALKPHLAEHGVLIIPGLVSMTNDERTDVVVCEWEFVDVETGESLKRQWPGAGRRDAAGNGIRGAQTSSLRTFLAKFFHLALGDDPEKGHADEGRSGNVAPRATGDAPSMRSKFDTECKLCGWPINTGDPIEKREGVWAHAVCPSPSDVPAEPLPVQSEDPGPEDGQPLPWEMDDVR